VKQKRSTTLTVVLFK